MTTNLQLGTTDIVVLIVLALLFIVGIRIVIGFFRG
jgi:hypothetical protein